MDVVPTPAGTTGGATTEERKFAWMKPYIERLVLMMKAHDTQQWLQVFLIDPVLSYIMNRFFAYFLVAMIGFGALLLFVILTFILLIVRTRDAAAAHVCVSCGLNK
jgi:hypothetical protein